MVGRCDVLGQVCIKCRSGNFVDIKHTPAFEFQVCWVVCFFSGVWECGYQGFIPCACPGRFNLACDGILKEGRHRRRLDVLVCSWQRLYASPVAIPPKV